MSKAADGANFIKNSSLSWGVPASTINEHTSSDELVLVQGVIDVYFIEDGEVVLADYKTDRVGPQGQDILIRRYKKQLEYYEKAVSQLTGRRSERKDYLFPGFGTRHLFAIKKG